MCIVVLFAETHMTDFCRSLLERIRQTFEGHVGRRTHMHTLDEVFHCTLAQSLQSEMGFERNPPQKRGTEKRRATPERRLTSRLDCRCRCTG